MNGERSRPGAPPLRNWAARALLGMGMAAITSPLQAIAEPAAPAPPNCVAHVGYDRNTDLPGYLQREGNGRPAVCVPFTATSAQPPPGYQGDFYVAEFSDRKLRERWAACKADDACAARLHAAIAARLPPNRERTIVDPHTLWLLGATGREDDDLDLRDIRRPGFFARAPYREPIAAAERRTYSVEFTVPPDPYERLHLHQIRPVTLRGWYLRGDGLATGRGLKRALILISNGGGGRLTAIEDASDRSYTIDPTSGRATQVRYPTARSGAGGQRVWREYLLELNRAGFDVLSYDRRGIGISGGVDDLDTLQQGRDILQVLGALHSGEQLRALTPGGKTLVGKAASTALRGPIGDAAVPVVLAGYSRGTMATSWAMSRNFDRACDYDEPGSPCHAALGMPEIKGAIMLSDFSAGAGYVTAPTDKADADRPLFLAALEVEHDISFFPASQPLAAASHWPALFLGRGLWDYAESLDGAIDVYRRVKGVKELAVVRGPHELESWPTAERGRVFARSIAFARAVVLGRSRAPGDRAWTTRQELVASSGDAWEPSSQPPSAAAKAQNRGSIP